MSGKRTSPITYKVETNGMPDFRKIPKTAWDLLVKKILEDIIEHYQEKGEEWLYAGSEKQCK